MTNEDFIALIQSKSSVSPDFLPDIKGLVEQYPYFVQARMLYTKTLKETNNIHLGANLKQTVLRVADRSQFYFFLFPEKMESVKHKRKSKTSSGDYFDLIDSVEKRGGDTKKSLKELAVRLKEARSLVGEEKIIQPDKIHMDLSGFSAGLTEKIGFTDNPVEPENLIQADVQEEQAKKLIREKKYTQALVILKELNLNYPKKSIYFADQIRFLEKVIANSKK